MKTQHIKLFILLGTFIFPLFVFAAAGGLIPCDGPDCNFASLVSLGNKIINFCIVAGTSVFSIMFMYAGFEYLTAMGDTGKISKAHTYFTNAVYGFIIMLAAWLIVDFILKALIDSSSLSKYRLLGN